MHKELNQRFATAMENHGVTNSPPVWRAFLEATNGAILPMEEARSMWIELSPVCCVNLARATSVELQTDDDHAKMTIHFGGVQSTVMEVHLKQDIPSLIRAHDTIRKRLGLLEEEKP